MIQLSTLPTKSPENPGRPAGPAERKGNFASQLDENLGGGERSGGKILPKNGKELPDLLPEPASAGRNHAVSVGGKTKVIGDGHAEAAVATEAEPKVSDDATKVVEKGIAPNEAGMAILPAIIELAPTAATLPVDGAVGEGTEGPVDPVLAKGGAHVFAKGGAQPANFLQSAATKKHSSGQDLAMLTSVAAEAEQPEATGKKSGGQEVTQDAGLARARLPQEFKIELAKDARDTNGAEPAVARVAPASSMVLPLAPVVNAQGGDAASLSPGAKQSFDAASVQQPVRPQDFSALVDRLVEARESARTGSVNLSVMHSDFGEVSLRFNHDNGNLSVAMASRDPDFARAVNAATPADGSHAGETPFQGGRREDGTGASSSRADGSANPSTQSERNGQGRLEDRDAAEQLDALANPAGPVGRAARGGIYA
jgi:hypothetical protein